MNQKMIEVFIESISHYYHQIGLSELVVETPYLLDSNNPLVLDFTGIIGISGKYKGCVYFTCPRILLTHTLMAMGEDSLTSENYCDMVGEVANTISGNVRKSLGNEFLISVPVVIEGEPDRIYIPEDTRCVVIPLKWKSYQAVVVVCLR